MRHSVNAVLLRGSLTASVLAAVIGLTGSSHVFGNMITVTQTGSGSGRFGVRPTLVVVTYCTILS
jgi:hypothetical protein